MERRKGQNQRNLLAPQACPRLPVESRRRPATARIRHHVTASQSILSRETHGGAAQQREARQQKPERAPGTGVASTPSPAQVSAGSPPRPLSKHSLPHSTTTRAARPAPRPRGSEPVPMSSPRPRGQQPVLGTLASVRASRTPQRRGRQKKQRSGQPARQPGVASGLLDLDLRRSITRHAGVPLSPLEGAPRSR